MNSKVKISIEKLNKIIQDVEHVYLFSGLKDSDFWNTYLKDAKLYISYLGLPKESFDSYIEDLEGITVGRKLILWNGGEISIADARKEQEIIVTTLGRIMREVELLNADIIDEVAYNDDTCQRNLETKKVFIVHGHDEAAKEAVARVLTKLGLIPIILHEQKNAGQTIIEKIENNSDVGFAIILYTECDEGRQKGESEYKSRARQNVVFEHVHYRFYQFRHRVNNL